MTKDASDTRIRIGDRVTCYRRGDWWWAEFSYDGRQHRQALKTQSKKLARARGIDLESDLSSGAFRKIPRTAITDLVKEYLGHLQTEDRAERTIVRYRAEFATWIAFFETLNIHYASDISIRAVEQYRAARKPKVAAATLYHETVVMKQLTKFAADRQLLGTNPLAKMKIDRPKPRPQPVFSLAQVYALVNAGGPYSAAFELMALTGLRIGELCWLTWDDVELLAGGVSLLYVRAKPGEWQPKDGDDRCVPLHPRAEARLRQLPRLHRFVVTAPPTVINPSEGRQLSDRQVLKHLKRVAKKLEIPYATNHAFRRFFVTFCADNGAEPFKLMRWVGHSDISMVLRYYKLEAEESSRAMAAIPFAAQMGVRQKGQNKNNSGGHSG